jgi:hypothetical protein
VVNLKRVLISLFGATAGQGVVWYTGQFYALFYLQTILKVNNTSANYIVAIALLLGMPLFVCSARCRIASAASDHDGRLPGGGASRICRSTRRCRRRPDRTSSPPCRSAIPSPEPSA